MKFFFLIIILVPAVLSASIATNERVALFLKYAVGCITKSGVSYAAIVQPPPSNDDPAYSDYRSCFVEKYFSDNTLFSPTNRRAINSTQYINWPVFESYSQKCAIESKISVIALIQDAVDNPPEDDPTYKKYVSCYLVKMGILTADGDIGDDATKVEKWLLSGSGQKVLDSTKTNCGDKKGETFSDTALLVDKCLENIT